MDEIISVIIPAYNAQPYLEKCVQSVRRQTYTNLQIILINDGSKDLTAQICDKLSEQDQRISVIHQSNHGVSFARNAGLRTAIGKYISFVDADDYLEQTMYAEMVAAYNVKPDISLVMCGWYVNNRKSLIRGFKNPGIIQGRNELAKTFCDPKGFCGYLWNKLFLRELIQQYDIRCDERYSMCEDALFCHQYIQNIYSAFFTSEPLYHYTIHKTSIINGMINDKRISVFDCYAEILSIYQDIDDKLLINKLKTAYTRQAIQIMAKLYQSPSDIYRKYKNICDEALREHLRTALFNRSLSLKHKAYLLLYLINQNLAYSVMKKLNRVS